MNHSDSLVHLAPALVAAQSDLRSIAKDATNPHFKNRYASLDAIIEAVRPVLASHGLAVVQSGLGAGEAGPGLHVETMLLHVSGEWICGGVQMPLAKNDPQGAGGAMTYGRRYGLSALLSLATDEDDDGNAASKPARQPRANKTSDAVPASAAVIHGVPVMPFGETKGQPLGQHSTPALQKVQAWVRDPKHPDRREKFADLDRNISAILNDRVLGRDDDGRVADMIADEDKKQSALPF